MPREEHATCTARHTTLTNVLSTRSDETTMSRTVHTTDNKYGGPGTLVTLGFVFGGCPNTKSAIRGAIRGVHNLPTDRCWRIDGCVE
mmetsp:Transcript_99733/g.171786  ORF Transcript_99733/g.171786 Transcript_99733/m.171786 type:complete len:87 (+) Transcript_99733:585-845(+)